MRLLSGGSEGADCPDDELAEREAAVRVRAGGCGCREGGARGEGGEGIEDNHAVSKGGRDVVGALQSGLGEEDLFQMDNNYTKVYLVHWVKWHRNLGCAQALGSSKVKFARWSRKAKDEYPDSHPGRELQADYPCRKVGEAVLPCHPILLRLASCGIGPLDLQFHEAEILARAMTTLRDRHDVAALPVHDSLAVPLGRLDVAASVLKEAFGSYLMDELGYPSMVIPSIKLKGLEVA